MESNGEGSMQQPGIAPVITRERYDAVLFDLDGVITDTASIHAVCWKQMFDEYLQKRATQRGEAFRPFDPVEDYRLHVDGKPRFDGVRDFLASRGIRLPEGSPHDPPEAETVGGLGNCKNHLVTRGHRGKGRGSLRGKRSIHRSAPPAGIQGRRRLLERELRGRLEVRQGGWLVRAPRRWRHGRGATPRRQTRPRYVPDCSRLLGVEPGRAVVVEDALSGIEAGLAGNFGLVVGVARRGNAEELRRHGAHLVVNDLGELVD